MLYSMNLFVWPFHIEFFFHMCILYFALLFGFLRFDFQFFCNFLIENLKFNLLKGFEFFLSLLYPKLV